MKKRMCHYQRKNKHKKQTNKKQTRREVKRNKQVQTNQQNQWRESLLIPPEYLYYHIHFNKHPWHLGE